MHVCFIILLLNDNLLQQSIFSISIYINFLKRYILNTCGLQTLCLCQSLICAVYCDYITDWPTCWKETEVICEKRGNEAFHNSYRQSIFLAHHPLCLKEFSTSGQHLEMHNYYALFSCILSQFCFDCFHFISFQIFHYCS